MNKLKEFRKNRHLTQREMAKKLKITYYAYRHYEYAERTMPNSVFIRFLRLRAQGDDLKLADILEESEIKNEENNK